MKNHLFISTLFLFVFFIKCTDKTKPENNDIDIKNKEEMSLAKFEPEDGKRLFFIGQDMDAIGGLEGYSEGYCDSFDIPAGITGYTSFSPGSESFGYHSKGNDGIFSKVNWGAGDCYLDYQVKAPGFENCLVAIGLSFVNHEKEIANGNHDQLIIDLANWIKSLGKRPVFLRLGYEFDGYEWNHYDKPNYLKSWKRIVDKFRELNVNNVAYVWQSKGTGTPMSDMEYWYPGDDYVDWCAYSYFGNPDTEMIKFARKHNKPVFIAEATPVFQEGSSNTYYDADLEKPEVAKKIWDEWFTQFIKTMDDNSDVIKAFSYINADWPSQVMWVDNITFKQSDACIQKSSYVSNNWSKEIAKDKYLKPTENLWDYLWDNNKE